MATTLIVMLIWFGGSQVSSGAATVQGFQSMTSCESSIPTVREFYKGFFTPKPEVKCVELQK